MVIPEGVGGIHIVGIIGTAEQTNTANTVQVTFQISQDASFANPINVGGYGWQGGTMIDKFTGQTIPIPFEAGFSPFEQYAGWRIRVIVDIAQPINNLGFDIRVLPTQPEPPQ